jgi:hypothetical protein
LALGDVLPLSVATANPVLLNNVKFGWKPPAGVVVPSRFIPPPYEVVNIVTFEAELNVNCSTTTEPGVPDSASSVPVHVAGKLTVPEQLEASATPGIKNRGPALRSAITALLTISNDPPVPVISM